jgi:hypothetical protein
MNSVAVNRRLSGSLIIAIVIFLAQGCAIQTSQVAAIPQPFELVDQRQGDEGSTEWLSRNRTTCDYTLRQLGDETTSPDRFTLLRAGLDATLHEKLVGKNLLVTHFAVYINNFERGREASFSMNGSFLGNVLEEVYLRRVTHRCEEEMTAAGRLEPVDVETHRMPVIVEITLIVDGKTHSVRSLFTPGSEISIEAKDPETKAAIHNAVGKAIQQLIAEMLIT